MKKYKTKIQHFTYKNKNIFENTHKTVFLVSIYRQNADEYFRK